ncbi:MAG TPA: flavin reductase family protein [Acidobacteriota bacterium]|nr:flavin reductase family protein [Acidobacteriota bacterium]
MFNDNKGFDHILLDHEGCFTGWINNVFALNTFAYGREEIGRHFGFVSGRDVNKLEGMQYFEGESGAPILTEAMAYLECELSDTFIAGDHTLFVGKVIGGQVLHSSDIPLVFERADFF